MQTLDLNQMVTEVHDGWAKPLWWTDINTGFPVLRNRGELLMLAVTELAEATEGIRKNLMDDKCPKRTMEECEMADYTIRMLDFSGGFSVGALTEVDESEFPTRWFETDNKAEKILLITGATFDVYCNLIDDQAHEISVCIQMVRLYCDQYKVDLAGAYKEKMAFNRVRADHQHEARRAENGKKF